LLHGLQTRTGVLLTPGTANCWPLHGPHTTPPQHLQWCLRLTTENSTAHIGQCVMSFSSIHAGCSASPGAISDCIESASAAESPKLPVLAP
jgi:hypothetical protein